jgi:hypothetical protein
MLPLDLPAPLRAFIEREFVGERLLWAGQPKALGAVIGGFAVWLFAIPWTAFSCFMFAMIATPLVYSALGLPVGGPDPGFWGWIGMIAAAIFIVPFVLIGFGMMLAPAAAWWKARHRLFVVTGRRAAIVDGGFSHTIESIPLEEISGLSRSERPNGAGAVSLSLGYERDSDGDRVQKTRSLGCVSDVRTLHRTLEEAIARRKRDV